MTHFHTDRQSYGDLTTNYPHSPEDQEQSVRDYLEDMLSQGYEPVSHAWYGSTSFIHFIFRVAAK